MNARILGPCMGLVLAVAAAPAWSVLWTADKWQQLTTAFSTDFTGYDTSAIYEWKFKSECGGAEDPYCFANNPDSPYGTPIITPGSDFPGLKMNQTDALVVIMQTPPKMDYFGMTPYLMSRDYDAGGPALPRIVFASIGDSFNHLDVGTTGVNTPFNKLSVFILGADPLTRDAIADRFAALQFPPMAINVIKMPLQSQQLRMGLGDEADTFGIIMRMAYPDYSGAMTDYMNRKPIRMIHVKPLAARDPGPADEPEIKSVGTGQVEDDNLRVARDQLTQRLINRYNTRGYTEEPVDFEFVQTGDYDCIGEGLPCNGDNPDTLYSRAIDQFTFDDPATDRILVVGVNHVYTGKATYFNYSLDRVLGNAGIDAFRDEELKDSALLMANLPANDPRRATWQHLYAFTVSYSCGTESREHCVPIPPLKLPSSMRMALTGRVYLEAATATRPNREEIHKERVFILRKTGGQ